MRGVAGRWLLLLTGSVVATCCYALTIRAHVGLGPLFVIQDGLSQRFGITVGTAVIITGVAFLVATCALRSWPGPGTVAITILGGVLIDAILPHVPDIHGVVLRLAVVTAASFVMTFGGALIITARLGVHPLDGVMLGLCRVLGRSVGPVRLVMEATMLVVGWILGGSVGVGTVITCVVIGPGLQFWLALLGTDRGVVPMFDAEEAS